jgi:nucleoside-triphosphatase THEP1
MNIFIEGNPDCGKWALVKKLLKTIDDKMVVGEREVIRIIEIVSGKEEILTSLHVERLPGVSHHRFYIEGEGKVMHKFLNGYENSQCAIIDEIGLIEYLSKKFEVTIEILLN